MPIIKKIILALFIFFGLAFVVGFFLPSEWKVKRTIEVNAPPQVIFPLINNVHNWGRWYPWSKSMDVSMVVTYEGPQSGTGAVRKWSGSSIKPGRIELTDSVPNQMVNYLFTSEKTSIRVKGTIQLQPTPSGCMISWEDTGDLEKSFFARLFSGSIDLVVGPKFEEGLKKLKEAAETGKK